MPTRRGVHVGISLLASVLLSGPAWATIDNFKTYKAAYPGKEPKAYSCKICHLGAIGKKGDLNPYGLSLQKHKVPVDAKKLTVEDYRAIEKDDADGDGASNLDEITAGTAPGDSTSVPQQKAKTNTPVQAGGEPAKGPVSSPEGKGGGK